ncbi:hypothetical protein ILUMI_26674 [Ignelater luminosus]|uniref:Uncharacterized protein n=1 Tax=Ignelater luminosus TaxID=2038154 RepID=A0A8K0FYF5_IGNLU|nr:hypothetical protein ILUMI_26674 [Ignelater luminosus]
MWDLDNVIEIHVEPLIINVGEDSSTSEWDDESDLETGARKAEIRETGQLTNDKTPGNDCISSELLKTDLGFDLQNSADTVRTNLGSRADSLRLEERRWC